MQPRRVICTWPDGRTNVMIAPEHDPDFAKMREWTRRLTAGETVEQIWPDLLGCRAGIREREKPNRRTTPAIRQGSGDHP